MSHELVKLHSDKPLPGSLLRLDAVVEALTVTVVPDTVTIAGDAIFSTQQEAEHCTITLVARVRTSNVHLSVRGE